MVTATFYLIFGNWTGKTDTHASYGIRAFTCLKLVDLFSFTKVASCNIQLAWQGKLSCRSLT